jgi:microcystin degradation protein MlrC
MPGERTSTRVDPAEEIYAQVPDDPRGGTGAVLRVRDVSVIVTERRRPFREEADLRVPGLDVRNGTDVVVKIGYLEPELFEMAADWRLALTAGGVDQDLVRWEHVHLSGPAYPFQPLVDPPDLTPLVIR